MKKNNTITINPNCGEIPPFEEYKNSIKNLIHTHKYHKLFKSENYFDITNNTWIIEKCITKYGFSNKKAPENSLLAYKNAIDKNYAIMITVEMLSDGTIVCFKGQSLAKLTGNSGYIGNFNIQQIKDLKLLDSDETIPTLEQALNFIDNKTEVIIDIDNNKFEGKMEERILKIIDAYVQKHNCYNKLAIMSVNPNTLEWFFNNAPWYTRILKVCQFKDEKYYGSFKTKKLKKLKYYKQTQADFVALPQSMILNIYVKKYKPVGILAMCINNQEDYIANTPYCDNIIFNGFEPKI